MGCEFHRLSVESPMAEMPVLDTCTKATANLCQIKGGRGGRGNVGRNSTKAGSSRNYGVTGKRVVGGR